jgi:hypothetical protein
MMTHSDRFLSFDQAKGTSEKPKCIDYVNQSHHSRLVSVLGLKRTHLDVIEALALEKALRNRICLQSVVHKVSNINAAMVVRIAVCAHANKAVLGTTLHDSTGVAA